MLDHARISISSIVGALAPSVMQDKDGKDTPMTNTLIQSKMSIYDDDKGEDDTPPEKDGEITKTNPTHNETVFTTGGVIPVDIQEKKPKLLYMKPDRKQYTVDIGKQFNH